MAKKDEIKKESVDETLGGTQTPKEPEEPTIQIKKSDFDMLMKTVETLSKDRDTLFKAADKNRLARVNDSNSQNLVKKVKISKWKNNGMYIIGWKLTSNVSEILPGSNRWVEDQRTMLVFEDGSTIEVPLIEYYRSTIAKDVADIIASTQKFINEENIVEYQVEFANGKKLLIDSRFVN